MFKFKMLYPEIIVHCWKRRERDLCFHALQKKRRDGEKERERERKKEKDGKHCEVEENKYQ